jgi:hypothetical protein
MFISTNSMISGQTAAFSSGIRTDWPSVEDVDFKAYRYSIVRFKETHVLAGGDIDEDLGLHSVRTFHRA